MQQGLSGFQIELLGLVLSLDVCESRNACWLCHLCHTASFNSCMFGTVSQGRDFAVGL